MKINSVALLGVMAAALTLSACDNNSTPAGTTTPAETPPAAETPTPAADVPAMAGDPPAMAGDPPAMAADPPAGVALTLADVVGVWAETPEACATPADTLTIAPDVIAVGTDACIITAVEPGATGLTVNILCPVTGGEPEPATWTVAGTGAAPFTQIEVAMADLVTPFVRCAEPAPVPTP